MPLTKEQLLIPRVMCVGGKEGEPNDTSGDFITGDILIQTVKKFCKWKSLKLKHTVYLDPDFVAKFPHLFRPMPWWYGRKPEEMPLYVNTNCVYGVLKVQKWVLIEEKKELRWRMECEKGGLFNISHFLELIPATLEEYQKQKQKQ